MHSLDRGVIDFETVRLEVTRKSELALRAVRELAEANNVRKGDALAAAVGTTPSFLAQALAPLVRARWLRSDPGPHGGYALAVEARSLSVLDIIEAIEGPTTTGECVLSADTCAEAAQVTPCALHDAWSKARDSLLRQLRRASVLDTPLSHALVEGSSRRAGSATSDRSKERPTSTKSGVSVRSPHRALR